MALYMYFPLNDEVQIHLQNYTNDPYHDYIIELPAIVISMLVAAHQNGEDPEVMADHFLCPQEAAEHPWRVQRNRTIRLNRLDLEAMTLEGIARRIDYDDGTIIFTSNV